MELLPQFILNSIVAGAVYTMIALGFTLIFSVTKFFNLAHGVLAAVGGYIVFYLAQIFSWPLTLSILVGVLGCAIVGYLLDRFIYGPLLQKKASSLILLVASLGVFTVLQAMLAMIFTSQFRSLSVIVPYQQVFKIFTGTITGIQLITLIVGLVIAVALVLIQKKTQFGKSLVAISDDEEVSKIIGINTKKVISRTFIMGSAIAGLAGILVGLDTGIEPNMGLPLLLKGIIAAIIGGLGNIYGAIVGAFLLGFVENFGIWKISGEWKDAIAFGLLIVFLVFRPQGIFKT